MKRLSFLAALVLLAGYLRAQNVGFTYQAVALDHSKAQTLGRDSKGEVLVNQDIKILFSIREGAGQGPIRYTELHQTTTDIFGIFRVVIGRGEITSDNKLEGLAWGERPYFLQVEIDLGEGFIVMGIEELMGSPYALNAVKQKLELDGNHLSITGGNSVDLSPFKQQVTENQIDGWVGNNGYLTFENQSLNTNGSPGNIGITNASSINLNVNDADADATNEIQTLSKTGTDIMLSRGGGTISVADNDNDSQNEIQTLTTTGVSGNIGISGSNTIQLNVNDADADPTNEIQTLSKSGTDITLSGGGGTISVADNDNDSQNEIQDLQLTNGQLTITNNPAANAINLSPYLGNNLTEEQVDAMVANNGYLTAETDGSVTNELQDLNLNGNTLSITNNTNATPIDLSPYQNVFETTNSVTSNENGNYATDDFVFGSPQLNDDANPAHAKRFFFDKSSGAFRAGRATGTQWDAANLGGNSTAFGDNNIASGSASTALGSQNVASGGNAIALGFQNQAQGDNSATIGNGNVAEGANTVATGTQNHTTGTFANALGLQNTASGFGAVAIGAYSNSTNELSVSIGNNSTASGLTSMTLGSLLTATNDYAVSIGSNSESTGRGSISIGSANSAIGHWATSVGFGLSARSFGESVFGIYNTDYMPVVGPDDSGYNLQDRLFVIGNGLPEWMAPGGTIPIRSDALVMLKNGNTRLHGLFTIDADNVSGAGEEYTLPGQDGAANQTLMTDGNGNVSWTNADNSINNEIQDLTLNTTTNTLSISQDPTPATTVDLTPYRNVFAITNGVTSNENGDYDIDDLVFGSPTIDYDGVTTHRSRLYFDKSRYSFRAGYATTSFNTANSGVASAAFGENVTASGAYSFGAGLATIASGLYSVALGRGSLANDDYTLAFGNLANASNNNAIALGDHATATGEHGIAFGWEATASGLESFAFGSQTNSSAWNTIALGRNSSATQNHAVAINGSATGQSSVAIGGNASGFVSVALRGGTSSGSGSLSFGSFSVASGSGAKSIGNTTTASGDQSTAIGTFLTVPSYGETAFGYYNTLYAHNNATGQTATDRLFVIGNGIGAAARSDALVILKSGSTRLHGQLTIDADNVSGAGGDYTFPGQRGTNGQVMVTNGSGVLSWSTLPIPTITTTANVTSNANGNYATDDFVFGSPQLSGNGNASHYARLFFDKSKGAFRAGIEAEDDWDDVNVGFNSVAFNGARASGNNSMALGSSSIASGEFSITMGLSSVASGIGALSFGRSATASGNYSIAIGRGSQATATYAVALGENSIASNENTFSQGYGATASGLYSFACGFNAQATQTHAASLGNSSIASGQGAFAIGGWSQSSGLYSTAIGLRSIARSFGEVSLGLNSSDYTPISANGYAPTDRLLVIGNGTLEANRSDALVMLKNGNTRLHGQLTIDADNVNGAGEAYTLPGQDGAADQILTTDGNGAVTWQDAAESILGRTTTIISNENGNYLTDSFVIGSPSLNDDGNADHYTRMFFEKTTGAFRVGTVTDTRWDAGERGTNSVAMGLGNIARGNSSLALGQNNLAHSESSTTIGTNNLAEGYNSFALGRNVATTGVHSMALSLYSSSRSYGETTMGIYAADYVPNSTSNFNANDRLFTVGNGLDEGYRSNALVIFKNGDATLLGTLTDASDMRLKRNIKPIQNSLSSLNNLQGVQYQWNGRKPQDTLALQTGLIAQEVEKIFPELVKTDEEGFKSVNYLGLIPHLIEAIKELKQENLQLKLEKEQSETRSNAQLSILEARLVALERLLTAPTNTDQPLTNKK